MITETSFTKEYRHGLTIEEQSLLKSIAPDSLESAIEYLKEQLPYVTGELQEISQKLCEKLQKMDTGEFAEIDLSEKEDADE